MRMRKKSLLLWGGMARIFCSKRVSSCAHSVNVQSNVHGMIAPVGLVLDHVDVLVHASPEAKVV